MKHIIYYIITVALSTSCSAAYWSSSAFSGDDMYDTYSAGRTIVGQKSSQQQTPVASYAPYQRPDSYYQYQYVSQDSVGTIAPKYVSSTFDVWEQEEIAQTYQTYVYVNATPAYYWGWGAYDPYYYGYNWGWNWGYPHYYGWGYAPARPPMRPVPNRPNNVHTRPNIVQRPSATTAPSTRSTSTVTRTPTKSTTTTTRPTTTTRSSSTRTSTTSSSTTSR